MLFAAADASAQTTASGLPALYDFALANGHVIVEALLLATIVFLVLQRSYTPTKKPLTEKEIDTLCAEWRPEPLVPELTPAQRVAASPVVVTGAVGRKVQLASGKEVLNFVSFDFLGLAGDPDVQAACAAAIQKYGVGSCGPRGFYGTIDVHLELEAALAEFMGTSEAMIFSYDSATAASTLPAFAKKGDLLLVDAGCGYSIQTGALLSRSEVRLFAHNDVAELAALLEAVAAEDAATGVRRGGRAPPNRRFIVVEGLYANFGDVAPLAAIAALARRHQFRLLVDESTAVGALPGGAGRGAAEHCGLGPGECDIVTGSLSTVLGAVGGFCAGSTQVVSHQRLNASGYCFSASLPPYLAAGALQALRALPAAGPAREALARNAAALRAGCAVLPGLLPPAGPDCSPVLHLRLADAALGVAEAEARLQRVANACLDSGVAVVLAKYSIVEKRHPPPSLRLTVSAAHTPRDVAAALKALRGALAREGLK